MNKDKKRECTRRVESEINWKSCREDDDDEQINIIKFITWNHGAIKESINIKSILEQLYHTQG